MNKRIVIKLEGGLVQNVYADDAGADCFVVDADTEGADAEDITTVEHDGHKVSAYIRCECAGSIVDSLPRDTHLLLEHDFPEDFPLLELSAQIRPAPGQLTPIQLSIDPKAVSRHSSAALGIEPADDDFDSVSDLRDAMCNGEIEITPAQHETLERLARQGFVVEIEPAGGLQFPWAIERRFRALMRGGAAPTLDELMARYGESWRASAEKQVRFSRGDDEVTLARLATRMLAAFRAGKLARPAGRIVGVETELSAAVIPGVPPLLARLDVLAEDGDQLLVTDLKTARARWSEWQVRDNADQLFLYHELAQPLARGKPIALQFAVLTKTRLPEVAVHVVPADPHRVERAKGIARRAWEGMQGGVIYPNPSPQQCPGCPFRRACDAWSG